MPDKEASTETNGQILLQAYELINGDRKREYGDPLTSFNRIAGLWSAYFAHHVTAKDVAMLMALLKISREVSSPKDDNLLDAAGYIGLAHSMPALELEKSVERTSTLAEKLYDCTDDCK